MEQVASQFTEHVLRSQVLTPERQEAFQDLSFAPEASPEEVARQLVRDHWLTRFQAERLLAGRFRELRIGPYVLTDLIGMGGMGAVYGAVEETSRDPVAVKVLSPVYKQDAGMRTRFRLEAHAGQLVHHPNLVRTYSHGTTDDVFGEMDYMAMELFRGIALHELLSLHGPLSWAMACDVIVQAAAGLEHLHSLGLIHRDVKPDNLLVDAAGTVKVIDYGLALTQEAVQDGKVQELGEEFTLTMLFGHDCLGTADYMPPEQAADSLAAGPASDVYALGCTLYTMLTGRRPYAAGSKSQLIESHRSRAIPRVAATHPAIPPSLDAAVARMMAKEPENRFQTMGEVILATAQFAVRRPVRFQYEELLRARRQIAEKKSSIARATAEGRSASNVRAAVLAQHIETGVAVETAVDNQPVGNRDAGSGRLTAPAMPSLSAAASAADAITAYSSTPDPQAPPRALLRFPNGPVVPVHGMHFTLGRGRENDLPLPVADLSSSHCSLTFDGDRWILRDLDSRNGVRVNGRKVKEQLLTCGDVISLAGSTHLRFELPTSRQQRVLRHVALAATAIAVVTALVWGLIQLLN